MAKTRTIKVHQHAELGPWSLGFGASFEDLKFRRPLCPCCICDTLLIPKQRARLMLGSTFMPIHPAIVFE
jgi:hypothetical protein